MAHRAVVFAIARLSCVYSLHSAYQQKAPTPLLLRFVVEKIHIFDLGTQDSQPVIESRANYVTMKVVGLTTGA